MTQTEIIEAVKGIHPESRPRGSGYSVFRRRI